MLDCYSRLPIEEKIEFLIWDDNRDPGMVTSDWPGWEKYIGPRRPIWPAPGEGRRSPLPRKLRAAVFARHGRICKHCGTTTNIAIDHIKAVINGGTDDLDNLQPLCGPCNSRKGKK